MAAALSGAAPVGAAARKEPASVSLTSDTQAQCVDSFVVRNAGLMFPNGHDDRQTRVQSVDSYNMASDLPFTAMPNPERNMSDVELIVTKCGTATKAY